MKRIVAAILFLLLPVMACAQSYSFGVINVRSALLTAQYWNPILEYVSKKSGVELRLSIGKSAQDTSVAEARGDFDFVYTNHIFALNEAAAGYRVFARTAGSPINGQIVVMDNSPIKSLKELQGMEVGFPSQTAFVGYAVPMSELIKVGVKVVPVYAGNQEGIIGQLRSGTIKVACVNSKTMRSYAERENLKYRALWTSEDYLDLPVAAHPRVAAQVVNAVRDALLGMTADAEGLVILKTGASLIKQPPPLGFVAARDSEYQNQRNVYRAVTKEEAH